MADAGGFYNDPYREDRIDIELRALPRLYTPEGYSWVCGGKLGAGGFGRAYLWNLVSNADQKVVDRVVLKYTEVRSEQIITNGGLGHGHIKEVFLQRSLVLNGTPPNQVFTVPLLGAEHCSWSLDSWRYYSPFFAFGDLFDLIETQGIETGSTTTGHRQIPEPFAWYILHRLVSAAVVMDTAFRTSQTDYQVAHIDMKPENIFLGAPGSLGKNQSFPLGDPWSFLMYGGCTLGWSAPEITRFARMPRSWQAPGGSHTNIWQIGYIMQSILMGIVNHGGDINWEQGDFDPVPSYIPLPKRTKAREAANPLRREYSPELLNILEAMVQFRVEDRPTPQRILEVVEELMPRFTQGMERWGTNQWFEELNAEAAASEDGSSVSGSEGTPLRGSGAGESSTAKLIDKFKYLFCVPAARPKRRRSPIERDTSPFSAVRARAASRKRRQAMVTRQIKEGLRPKLQRYVSPDPSDDKFVLKDDLKILHPKRPDTIGDYFEAPDPAPTYYKEDIDDVDAYQKAKRAFERAHPDDFPPVGEQTYNFRKEGEEVGEEVLDYPSPTSS
ncbi:kinase-like protein [Aureobasidium sp. EXF-10727]|nr:kinase-like protein [Aureobasidium sp. EXF-10727]KAI4726917.1 kinase-like protein [Aureobasidium sp. EXF-10728]